MPEAHPWLGFDMTPLPPPPNHLKTTKDCQEFVWIIRIRISLELWLFKSIFRLRPQDCITPGAVCAAIFRTRTSWIIHKNFIEMSEGWVNWVNDLWLPLKKMVAHFGNMDHKSCEFDTTLCEKVCQWLATGRWFSPPIKLTATI